MCLSWRPAQALKGVAQAPKSLLGQSASQDCRGHTTTQRGVQPKFPRPSGPASVSQGLTWYLSLSDTGWNRALGWSNWTVWGRVGSVGIHVEATAGVPRLASPHHLDLAWLLWPLLSPTMGHDLAGAPLPEYPRHQCQPPGSPLYLGVISPWPSASSCPWNVGQFGAGLGLCTAHFAGTHPEVHLLLMLKMLHPQQPHTHRPLWPPPLFSFF